MLRKLFLPSLLIILGLGFWLSPNFKEIAAGVALFLFGMMALEEGFKAFTGGMLEKILSYTTNKTWKSLLFGFVTTTLMQSSSLVSVIAISFISAGLVTLTQGIGIVFGANIGTTTGAWLIAVYGMDVNIASYAMPMLVFGVTLLFQKAKPLRGFGYVLVGIGLLFLGIHFMKEGFHAVLEHLDLTLFAVEGWLGLLLFTAVGIVATVVMQSSHATLVLIITALYAQQVTYDNALALVIGANIGTTVTAILGAVSANIDGKRLAAAHLLFKLVSGLIAVVFIHQAGLAVDWLAQWWGIAADAYTIKLAIFHTLFNVVGVALMLPLISTLAHWLNVIVSVPESPENNKMVLFDFDQYPQLSSQSYLNDAALNLPDTAVEAVRNEVWKFYHRGIVLITTCLRADAHDLYHNRPLKDPIENDFGAQDHTLPDALYQQYLRQPFNEILSFASRIPPTLTPRQSAYLFELKLASRDILEATKDTKHFSKNLYRYLASPNSETRSVYLRYRERLLAVLAVLATLPQQAKEEQAMILDRLQLELEKNDILLNGEFDELIRSTKIPANVSASLINDNSYLYDIILNLLTAGKILVKEAASTSAEQVLEMDAGEFRELAENRAAPSPIHRKPEDEQKRTGKMLKKIKSYLSKKKRLEKKQADELGVLLKKMKKREKALKELARLSTSQEQKAQFLSDASIIHNKRKKGIERLAELVSEQTKPDAPAP